MILRCTAPRKNDRFRLCGWWLATVPDGARLVGVVEHSSQADPSHIVLGCGKCGTLFAIRAEPLTQVA